MREGKRDFPYTDMSVASEFKAAETFLKGLDAGDRERLREICVQIQGAEKILWDRAAPLLKRCMTDCQGLCCRNINLEDILARGDFLYILTLLPDLAGPITRCLARETAFSADCVFLQGGAGPCLFPPDVRPKVCIMTFCFDDSSVKKELRCVGAGFNALGRFIWRVRGRAALEFFLPRRFWNRFGSSRFQGRSKSKSKIAGMSEQ